MAGIDTNILVYAHDKTSPYFMDAVNLIADRCACGVVGIASLSLLEFYAVITDGRKLLKPLSPSEACAIVADIMDAEEFNVFDANAVIRAQAFGYAQKIGLSKYGINDLIIASTFKHFGIKTIYTRNVKDFRKFDFIDAVNPFGSAPAANRRPSTIIPYGRQSIDEKDVSAVCNVLRSDYLTTGPKVADFERAVADRVAATHGVAVSSGTAALHCAMYALGIGPGDEVIVPPITFAATANCVCFMGGTPVFADVDANTLLIDPEQVARKITLKTKAIIGVDYAGHPCDWDALREIADRHGLALVADGCHALGAKYKGRRVGTLADMTVFSFHPVKHITTGEGGMVVTDDARYAASVRTFRNHGITQDALARERSEAWFYEMQALGMNYRLTDMQCALGLSQLEKLESWLARRRELAAKYGKTPV